MSEPFVFRTEAQNRQSLAREIEWMLATQGPRVLSGIYEVSIRRLSKKETDEIARREADESAT